MRKPLASGTLWWLLREMPEPLQQELNTELETIDELRRKKHKQGDTRLVSLANHLRWMTEHRADLGEMKLTLFNVLTKYLPITLSHMLNNQLPPMSECSYFWGRQISQLEKSEQSLEPINAD